VDTDEFLPPNLSRPLEPFTFLGTGRICPQKDFPFFKALAKQGEFRDCRFIWISGEPQEDRQLLPNLSVWGQRTSAEVAAALREANCYVNTSRWEGLSRGLLEAAATSLPLAFRNAPGNRELALRMPDSFMFNGQQEAIAVLLTIWRNVKKNPRYGTANRHVVEVSYNARQTQRRMRSVYDGIVLSRMLRNEDFSKLHAARQPLAAA
jgi:glycosyltransferase involved in cell wall biosynthesis